MASVLRLPDHGRLLVATDLQGNLRDFERMADLFQAAAAAAHGDAHLLFTGDLIHGPHLEPEDWPDFLGAYYRDQSPQVIDGLVALEGRFPGHVHALLGNHEHAHVGGPHTAKFAPDEVVTLESTLGPTATQRLHAVLSEFPLAAIAPCGVVFTHGAPAAEIAGIEEVLAAPVSGHNLETVMDIFEVPVIGKLLWARSAPSDVARRFLAAMGGRIAIFGHDVVPQGFERIGDEQMIVSTSFGVPDANKFYLELDLSARYQSVQELRLGTHILPLYPDARPRVDSLPA
jgi:calcineurin-like phosphoesterase family protein